MERIKTLDQFYDELSKIKHCDLTSDKTSMFDASRFCCAVLKVINDTERRLFENPVEQKRLSDKLKQLGCATDRTISKNLVDFKKYKTLGESLTAPNLNFAAMAFFQLIDQSSHEITYRLEKMQGPWIDEFIKSQNNGALIDYLIDDFSKIKHANLTSNTTTKEDAIRFCADVLKIIAKYTQVGLFDSRKNQETLSDLLKIIGCAKSNKISPHLSNYNPLGITVEEELTLKDISFPASFFDQIIDNTSDISIPLGLATEGSDIGKSWIDRWINNQDIENYDDKDLI